ncbi:MAG: response regulator, partial [Gemmatimonadota bacterium]|nr:response regulator [Gemmatimonadota bacterium]
SGAEPRCLGWMRLHPSGKGARTRHILFLVISAYVLETDQERVRLAGGDAFLPKPCLPSRMLVEVLRLLATPAP